MPPPTPTPARDRLPLTLLRIDSATTGEDLVTHLLAGEDTCLKSMMGDSKFKQFEESLLMEAVSGPVVQDPARRVSAAGQLDDSRYAVDWRSPGRMGPGDPASASPASRSTIRNWYSRPSVLPDVGADPVGNR